MFPPDHVLRASLAEEIHARPPEAVQAPARASYVAVLIPPEQRAQELAHLVDLCEKLGVRPPAPGASHFRAVFQAAGSSFRLKWERHGEFSGYTVIAPGVFVDGSGEPFQTVAATLLPPGWLAALPGVTIAAAHAKLLAAPDEARLAGLLDLAFGGQTVAGAEVADGAARVYTDYQLHGGCTRFVLIDRHLTERQAGRTLQRLFEIEAYRMLALLALPIARKQGPRIVQIEAALAQLTDGIAQGEGDDEALLHELTRLAAEVESGLAASQFRFGACRAYEDLVMRRIAELRERRLPGLPTIEEFMARRFRPAVATCATVSQRLHDLSERVAQASALLSTRVDIARERQNQALLASMDRRAKLQLRLQQTVEGLSVAAICYYVAGLVGYGAKALKAGGLPVDADLLVGLSIPLVAVGVMLAVRRARRRVAAGESAGAATR